MEAASDGSARRPRSTRFHKTVVHAKYAAKPSQAQDLGLPGLASRAISTGWKEGEHANLPLKH